jgi:hypothetical protein
MGSEGGKETDGVKEHLLKERRQVNIELGIRAEMKSRRGTQYIGVRISPRKFNTACHIVELG